MNYEQALEYLQKLGINISKAKEHMVQYLETEAANNRSSECLERFLDQMSDELVDMPVKKLQRLGIKIGERK